MGGAATVACLPLVVGDGNAKNPTRFVMGATT